MEKVRLKYMYLFDKIKVNFHAILLILHVFQADMIYMYRNSDVVNLMFPADHFFEMYTYFELHINLVAGKQVQYLFFFFNFVAWCKAFALCNAKDNENIAYQQFHGPRFYSNVSFRF